MSMVRSVWLVGLLGLVAVALASPQTAVAGDRHHKKKPPVPAPPPPAPVPEPPPPPPEEKPTPWSEGVSAEQKAEAQRLLEQGNAAFVDGKLADALASYQQALKSWDHPAIRFNMVRTLIQLNRPLEAQENLEKALKYGAAPLEEGVYQEALTVQKLLANMIADVEVGCDQTGVTVTLDAEPLVACPGRQTRRLEPGKHLVISKKDGFLTDTKEVIVMGGKKESVSVKLIPLAKAGVEKRRWKSWKPWAVVGAGALVGGIGGLLQWQASSDMKAYEREVDQQCAETGCTPQQLDDLGFSADEHRALRENKIAIGLMAVGGASLVTGAVLVFMNRPYTVYP
ncbi:MAG TPA: hypothetical protein VL172_00385, partial [Kofleriaceae bacterium]|nr:hypothetical protein [Kofleriaceae bacterium]